MKTVHLKRVRETAENYYRNGDYYCSEAIVRTIRDEFDLDYPDKVVAMASGFPVGMGYSGCTCGAVVGGIMALGMAFGRTEAKDQGVNRVMELAHELHDFFRAKHKVLCCRVHIKGMELGSPEHMTQCIAFTGEIAAEVARLIARDLLLKIDDQ